MTTTFKAPAAETGAVAKAAVWFDERTSVSGAVKELGRKIFPDHWSFMLGEVALYSFIAILLSGTFLTFFFDPSMAHVEYEGSYVPLQGMGMSAAMASTLDISFDVRGGLLMRQVHHWAALLFVASIMLHMARIYFTGAFRKPRELNWVIGLVLWVIAMLEGFSGYSLPDDLLSGNGLRIVDGMIKGVPVLGTWISFWLFGGEFPGDAIVGRLYSLHIMLLPAVLIVFLVLHLLLMVRTSTRSGLAPVRPRATSSAIPCSRCSRARPLASCSSCSASSSSSRRRSRSTRFGTMARTTRRRFRQVRSLTGTSASVTACCD